MSVDLYQAGCSCGWNDSFDTAEAMREALVQHHCPQPRTESVTLNELLEWKQSRSDHPQSPAGVAVTPEQWNTLLDRLPAVPRPGTFGVNPTLVGLPVVVARPTDDIPVGYVRLTSLAEGTP